MLTKDPVRHATKRIAAIISNRALATAIVESICAGLRATFVHLPASSGVWEMFSLSLNVAIRDIESHPRGEMFRRLIQFGPPNPDDPMIVSSTGKEVLSDPECGQCVDFIFSHMINRFKGELAELLAIEPIVDLIRQLMELGTMPPEVQLYWGDTIQEPRCKKCAGESSTLQWGSLAKGADGLVVSYLSSRKDITHGGLVLHAVVEVKSMARSLDRIKGQIQKHVARLDGGARLDGDVWASGSLDTSHSLAIAVVPSSWRLSRSWHWSIGTESRSLVHDGHSLPPNPTHMEQFDRNFWKITLAWSREALEQAAYEMTFWYMAQVGRKVYGIQDVPPEWQEMSPDEAGRNAIKMMLYYIMLRYISKRQGRRATKLYNVYSFGYPVGVGAKDMLWPDDLPNSSSDDPEQPA